MQKIILISLFFAFAAYGQQQQRIAILGTEDDGDPPVKILDLTYLTDKLREIASNILPSSRYGVMTQQSIVDMLGSQEQAVKICKEASCLAELGRKVNADYIAQARIGRFGGNLAIKIELYNVGNGNLIASFTDNSKNVQGLLSVLETKAPALFGKISNNDAVSNSSGQAQNAATSNSDTFTDSRDGRKYRTVKIGKLVWMAENLNYNESGSSCYGNSEFNCEKYGRQYDWNAAMKACPSGWHLPDKAEWRDLAEAVGGKDVAKHLKAKSGWSKGRNGIDTYGFAAIPSGFWLFSGRLIDSSLIDSNWWTSTSSKYLNGKKHAYYADENVALDGYTLKEGFMSLEVRCVQDY
jgi:uncharacterized protein (TIGR02145 family)